MDDILIKDKDGKLKILHDGVISDIKDVVKEKLREKMTVKENVKHTLPEIQFSSEDEEELSKYVDKKQEIINIRKKEYIASVTDEIASQANISFKDESGVLLKRFKNIVSARLNNIRNNALTTEALLRKAEDGGIGLSKDEASKVVNLIVTREPELIRHEKRIYSEYAKVKEDVSKGIEVYKEELAPPPPALQKLRSLYQAQAEEEKILQELKKEEKSKDNFMKAVQNKSVKEEDKAQPKTSMPVKPTQDTAEPDIKKEAPKPIFFIPEEPEIQLKKTEIPKLEPKIDDTEIQNNKDKEIKKQDENANHVPSQKLEDIKTKPIDFEEKEKPKDMPRVTKLPAAKPLFVKRKTENVSMDDIVSPAQALKQAGVPMSDAKDSSIRSKLISPVEELKMPLKDYRRMSDNPTTRSKKIIEKVELLEETSYGQKIKGIEAWKGSDVNKLYIEMGYESMTKGVSIEQIIADRDNNKQDFLTREEFDAIVELNKKLSF